MFDKLTLYYKKFSALLLSVLLFFFSVVIDIGPKAVEPINATRVDYAFDNDRILIGGYGYNLSFTDDEHLGYVRDAGIDFLVSSATPAFLDACEQNGIGLIAKSYGGLPTYGWTNIDTSENSPWLTFTPDSFVDHPALWGNDLMDEPGSPSFPALAKMMESYYSKTDGKIPYVNLYPAYASEEQLEESADWYAFSDDFKKLNTYQKHINAYIENIDSDYISADIYPLMSKKDSITGEQYDYARTTWLKNLDILAVACRETNRDLWIITQVVGLPYEGSTVTRITDEADIRWQAYISVSFGAKAIIHACYQNGWWEDESHLVNKNGERTDAYYAAQAVNAEIKAISDVYMDYNNIGAYVHNGLKQPHTRIALSSVDFDAVSNLSSKETLLVGCFEAKDGGGKAFTLVNMEETRSGKAAEASFSLKDAGTVTAYVKGVPTILTPDASGSYSLSLESGEGIFVTIE